MFGRIIVLGLLYNIVCDGHKIGNALNVTVNVTVFKDQDLKFNISWLPPKTGRKPSSYSIFISSFNLPNSSCNDGSIFYAGQDAEQRSAVLPENRYGFEVDETELEIEPGCTYRVQVYANPRSTNQSSYENTPTVLFTVPECIGGRCNCDKALESLPVPLVTVRTQGGNHCALVTWKVDNSSAIKSYRVSVGEPHITSSSGLTVYNKTVIFTGSGSDNFFAWKPKEKIMKGTKIFVAAQDSYGCWGSEGFYLIKSSSQKTQFSKRSTTLLFIGFMVLSLTIGITLIYIKFFLKSPHYKLLHLVKKSPREITPVWDSSKIEFLLKNRNVLYHEQEGANSKDPLEISPGRVVMSRELGRGQFGRVYLADLLEATGRRQVAVKTSLTPASSSSSGSEIRQQLLEEISIIKMAGPHPHLVELVGYCTLADNPVCLLLEYMAGGDLLGYLHRKRDSRGNSFTENSIGETSSDSTTSRRRFFLDEDDDEEEDEEGMRFALEIAKGMAHLEAKGIVHRDLAARNVLMNDNLVLKISDFGLSRDGGTYIIGSPGARRLPIRWMPPEAINRRAFTSKSDVWSYGVVLWEIATFGEFPYAQFTKDDDLLRHLLEDGGHPDFSNLKVSCLKEIMSLCWAKDPYSRPNFGQVVELLESKTRSGCKSNPGYQGIGGIQLAT